MSNSIEIKAYKIGNELELCIKGKQIDKSEDDT